MIKKMGVIALIMLFTLNLLTGSALADSVRDELKALKARIDQLEQKLSEQDGKLAIQGEKISAQSTTLEEVKKVKDAIGNLEFYVGATSIIQGTMNNDTNARNLSETDDSDDTDVSYSFNIEISSKIGNNGMALVPHDISILG